MIVKDEKFKNLWEGEQCLIIGSGRNSDYLPFVPALNEFPGKIIGCNTAYMVGYRTDMIIWVDQKLIKNIKHSSIDCLKFSITGCPNGTDYDDNGIYWIKAIKPERFSNSFDAGMYPADLTGYIALNTAYLIGCNPIYLSGFISEQHQYFAKRKRFDLAAKQAATDGREICVCDFDSILRKEGIFAYKEAPLLAESQVKGTEHETKIQQPPKRERGRPKKGGST